MARERPDHTLEATALVHELYLLLLRQRKVGLKDRAHFFTFAAALMRMVLRDWARERHAGKRGGGAIHVPLSDEIPWLNAAGSDLMDLETALTDLEGMDVRAVRLFELRCFLGCSKSEAAELLGISTATAERDLRLARAFLFERLRGGPDVAVEPARGDL